MLHKVLLGDMASHTYVLGTSSLNRGLTVYVEGLGWTLYRGLAVYMVGCVLYRGLTKIGQSVLHSSRFTRRHGESHMY